MNSERIPYSPVVLSIVVCYVSLLRIKQGRIAMVTVYWSVVHFACAKCCLASGRATHATLHYHLRPDLVRGNL